MTRPASSLEQQGGRSMMTTGHVVRMMGWVAVAICLVTAGCSRAEQGAQEAPAAGVTTAGTTQGGLNITLGPSSRRSVFWVAASSPKLSVKPSCSPQATVSICSPIQARGRKLR